MNIYLISQTVNNDYDTFDSAVVYAKSVKQARDIHPLGKWDSKENLWRCWVDKENTDKVEVTYLGKAKTGAKSGVIVASFNAG